MRWYVIWYTCTKRVWFFQVLPDFGDAPLCDYEEYNQLLREIYKSLENYLGENQESEEESVSLFIKKRDIYNDGYIEYLLKT